MASTAEVGACKVEVESYQCSIKKITASTKWKAPSAELSETVTTTVFESKNATKEKTIYLVTSPEGKKVTIKVERDEGQCKKTNHKEYVTSWIDYKKEEENQERNQNPTSYDGTESKFNVKGLLVAAAKDAALSAVLPYFLPYNLITTPIKKEEVVKNESIQEIKCFEIAGVLEALKYWNLPLDLEYPYTTTFKHVTCKEGPFQYKIISYPDISFKLEASIGTTEKEKKKNGRSHFERQTNSKKYLTERATALVEEAPKTDLKFKAPSFTASTTYNGGKDELEVKLDFDKEKDFLSFKYKHDPIEAEIGSGFIQDISGTLKKFKDCRDLVNKFRDVEKNFKKLGIDLVKNYKPYKFEFNSPNISLSVEGQYQTSKDLTRIGKFYDICLDCEPLLSISLTIDLLFLILSAASAGTAAGIIVLLKNLDKVIEKLLGKKYKKKYEDTKPFECDIYFDLVVTGAINGEVHWIIDTSEKSNPNSTAGSIEGVLSVDLKAGIKASIKFFYFVSASGEISASGSSGIKLKIGFDNRVAQGEGLIVPFETMFLGITIKYCLKGSVGLTKIFSIGGGFEGETELLDKRRIEFLSGKMVFFEEKSGSYGKGSVGNGGGGVAWGPNGSHGGGGIGGR
jgi:hypothetical protein